VNPSEFIMRLTTAAVVSSKATGVPASITIAQAALESAWGESGLARNGNNLFGRRIQPVDATHSLNISAGVWKPSVLRGLSFNCRAMALS